MTLSLMIQKNQLGLPVVKTRLTELHAELNKRHAMHAEAMTFHKGSLRIFRKFDRKFQES